MLLLVEATLFHRRCPAGSTAERAWEPNQRRTARHKTGRAPRQYQRHTALQNAKLHTCRRRGPRPRLRQTGGALRRRRYTAPPPLRRLRLYVRTPRLQRWPPEPSACGAAPLGGAAVLLRTQATSGRTRATAAAAAAGDGGGGRGGGCRRASEPMRGREPLPGSTVPEEGVVEDVVEGRAELRLHLRDVAPSRRPEFLEQTNQNSRQQRYDRLRKWTRVSYCKEHEDEISREKDCDPSQGATISCRGTFQATSLLLSVSTSISSIWLSASYVAICPVCPSVCLSALRVYLSPHASMHACKQQYAHLLLPRPAHVPEHEHDTHHSPPGAASPRGLWRYR